MKTRIRSRMQKNPVNKCKKREKQRETEGNRADGFSETAVLSVAFWKMGSYDKESMTEGQNSGEEQTLCWITKRS